MQGDEKRVGEEDQKCPLGGTARPRACGRQGSLLV